MEHLRQHTSMFNGLLDNVRSDIVSRLFAFVVRNVLSRPYFKAKGSEQPSVCASLIKNSKRSGLSDNEVAWLVGTL